ncbi:MAG: Holliday junction branch migration protein RuvA [Puniceicoccales bacterium]|nr:Holliday junction branch migration protein RuvA [Puniceicoccales bacterium]
MIVSLEGCLTAHTPLSCIINVQGIGYEVFVPLAINLPRLDETIKLWIYAIYREDNQLLYGFNTLEERNFFKLIVEKVSGIGPRTALAMLSKFKLSELNHCIATKNVTLLAGVPGIGKKTAEKIIWELSDKIKSTDVHTMGRNTFNSQQNDAILGLIALGYKRTEAEAMIIKFAEKFPEASADQLIKNAITIR